MIDLSRVRNYYVACGYTDIRRGIDGLAEIVMQQYGTELDEESLFLFCGRRTDRIKALYYSGDGYVLLYLSSVIFSSESNTFTVGSATVDVTGVSLDKTAAQTIEVDGKVSFTATVAPDGATDKTVKWSVGGTDAGAVKLYSDEACENEIGMDATGTLTVYAKGISAGTANVTVTSNADSTKTASCAVTVNETQQQSGGTDVLTRDDTGRTGTSYGEWSGVTKSSGAIYAGQSAGDHESIQLRSNNNNSGIVTTTSGGKATKVRVVWNSNTTNRRTLNVYGKNSAYSAASDLYGGDQGDLLGTIVCGESTELTISGDYTYIGMRSNSGAMYLDSITIEWGGSTPATVAVTGVSLDPSAAQTIEVDGTVSFTATVEPDNATDKTVKWSVGGTDAGAVKLYTDADCTTEVGADATETLTVYAKGISAGSATVTATSNADSEKAASCTVTVNATSLPQWTNGNVIATLDGTKLTVAKNTDTDGAMGTGWTGVGSATAWNNVRETITEIDIQSGVTSIGMSAISECSKLSSVTIPASVTSIGNNSFYNCSSLSSVTIPASVTSIGDSAFYKCASLASVTFEPVSETEALAGNTLVLGYNPFGDTASGATVAYGTGNTVLYDGDTEITAGTALTNIGMTTLTWKARAEETFPANAIVYDFAAEAVLIHNGGAKPQNRGGNQNSGQGFYAWENDGRVDSLRNDYKGFFVADGSQLPSDCHVWRRSDRYDQSASWSDSSGLLFPNAREYAIDGLEPGSRVVFVYDAAPGNEMIWAVGDGSSANLGHPRATATINGADAVIGQTPIPSGTEVVVNSVTPAVMGTGYIVVKVNN